MKKFYWFGVLMSYLVAFTFLAFCISLPMGMTGFFSGYVGWPIVVGLMINQLDDETRDALKKWATKKTPSDVGAPNGEEADN